MFQTIRKDGVKVTNKTAKNLNESTYIIDDNLKNGDPE